MLEWDNFFLDSFSVDFFHSSSKSSVKVLKPRYYGQKAPAYAYLAPKYCPVSFGSSKTF